MQGQEGSRLYCIRIEWGLKGVLALLCLKGFEKSCPDSTCMWSPSLSWFHLRLKVPLLLSSQEALAHCGSGARGEVLGLVLPNFQKQELVIPVSL